MAKCDTGPNSSQSNKVSGAFPNSNNPNTSGTGLQINYDAINNPVFDINAMLPAVQEYMALNTAINQMIGYEVRWFRAVPQYRSQDVIFQEYTLYNVEDEPKCIKVVLPDGNFPDSKYNYDLMGLEYEVPLEIQIDKRYWEYEVGSGTAPQKGDIVYFAIPNKLYEVVSSYLLRGFMEQETTWKINLRKYQPQASRREGAALTETIDKYTVSSEELFGEKTKSDVMKIVDDKQFNPNNSASRDKYKIIDPDLYIANVQLEIYGVKVAETFYDLNSSKYFDAVKYKGIDQITTSDDRCITAWTMFDAGVLPEYVVESIILGAANAAANYTITLKSKHETLQLDSYVEIYRPGALSFYAQIIAVTGSASYEVKIDQPVITHLSSIKANWISATNYKLKPKSPANILDGINDTEGTGFKVNIFANQYIKIKYGTQEHIAICTDKLLDKEWYGIVVNVANTFSQYNVYVYKQHPTDNVSKLQTVFYETLDFTPEMTTVEYYSINKSPSMLTNLRLYAMGMEEEKQKQDLLRYFVKDGDQLIIGDNADLKFRAPYTGQQR